MYTGWIRLLIVFLSHIIIVPLIPGDSMAYAWGRGLLQATTVMIMHSFSEGSALRSTFVSYLYIAALAMWVGIKANIALKQAKQ
jgi:hypothetical protein